MNLSTKVCRDHGEQLWWPPSLPMFSAVQAPPLQSQFDPMELMGCQIPFVDPFGHDFFCCEFQESNLPFNNRGPLEQYQESPAHPYVSQVVPINIDRLDAHTNVICDRVRLTSDQAISIFNQRETKTKHTAALLSAKYGISPKAIRDIWTRRSWVTETRLYWTLLEQQSFDTGQALTCQEDKAN